MRRAAKLLETRAVLRSRAGFTLLEMLVVVFILAALALSTVAVTQDADSQFRYEDTLARREAIRRAALGSPDLQLNGQPLLRGFVADMGRLPISLRELVEQDQDPDPALLAVTNLAEYGFVPLQSTPGYPSPAPASWASWGLAGGWRGPYLSGVEEDRYLSGVEEDRVRVFRDGWGRVADPSLDTTPDALNYGWDFRFVPGVVGPSPTGDKLTLQSYGADLVPGSLTGEFYEREAPTSPALVSADDYQLDLATSSPKVKLLAATTPLPGTIRLRLYFLVERQPPSPPGADRTVGWEFVESDDFSPTQPPPGEELVSFNFAAGAFVPMGSTLAVVMDTTGGTPLVLNPAQNTPKPLTVLPRANLGGVTLTWRAN